jgi:protoporphyrinogen oxidase
VRVAVIGAGVGGLAAAHRLIGLGHAADVYERWPGLGGQAATLDVGGGHRIERYYHVALRTDRHLRALYDELGLGDELEWRPSSVAMFADGRLHPFTTPLDLLRYRPLSPAARLRLGATVLHLQRRRREVGPFEDVTARAWIERVMGQQVYDRVWGPLLRGKFGARADDIAMAWLWSKLMLRRELKGAEARRELLGYGRGGWEPLFAALRERIEAGGGRVMIDRPAASLARDGDGFLVTPGQTDSFRRGSDPRTFAADGPPERYDAVIATVPNDVFAELLDPALAGALSSDYHRRLAECEYYAAVCLVLELDRAFSPYFWMNVVDADMPFVGLVEHTNFVEPARYDGRRFLYVANYVARNHRLMSLGADALLDEYLPGLRRVNRDFERSWIRDSWLFREPAAQPVVTVGYRRRIPPLDTGVPGLVLSNTTQVYPQDRGTNYAIALAEQAVALVTSGGR